jgi:mannitol-1-phosphate/altronate dehydrogenase
MSRIQLKIVFKPPEIEKNIDQIIEELVNDTIAKVLSKYTNQGYNINKDMD